MIEYLLTAPFEQVFDQTEVRFEAPPDTFKRYKTRKCPRCGEDCREPFLRVVGGEIVCLDCAEKK
jgi:formylmethanofuran dehydrogenase subunit E